MLFTTTLVGSYPQPDWLIDRAKLRVPRVRVPELWRVSADHLGEAQDDATVLAVRAQEEAGIDVVTDGEIRRESYSNYFGTRLDGIDLQNPGVTRGRGPSSTATVVIPRVTGPIVRRHPVDVDDMRFLRSITTRPVRATIPGPFTLSQLSQDEYYGSDAALALAYAAVVKQEMDDLFRAGADVVQLDEPWMEARPERALAFGLPALRAALEGASGVTAVHICFGYGALVPGRPPRYAFLRHLAGLPVNQVSIESAQSNLDCRDLENFEDQTVILGVLDLSTAEVESAGTVVERVERALHHVPPDRVILAPDCGMKFLPRQAAAEKLRSMVRAAEILRARYPGN
ncbi:MAG TPA: uroporphyrinogen decarboxylase family protein [Streptosporangiaceae bacterium]|nr:uroporphyrinogen decarboxylase family protein [Streptosporangiaceae bacterium]